MRSAEASGAGATGFGAGKIQQKSTAKRASSRKAARLNLSPVAMAVGITALLSATLFVVYDTARTLRDVRPTVTDDFAEFSSSNVVQAGLISPETPSALGQQMPQDVTDWTGMLQRGGAAFALAGLAVLVTSRRRRSEMPSAIERQGYETLAAAIPLGVACWTKSGKMIVCNDQYRSRLDLPNHKMTYHEAVKRMTAGGYIKLLNEDDGSRMIELHKENGECLLIDERPLDNGAFMTLISDITEAKKTDTLLHAIRQEQRLLARRYHEEKLKAEAASRSKTNFLAHLSHDIRTPLNHIIGFAELMRHEAYGPLGDERYTDYVQTIKTSGEHLLASFATILDLVELESGQKTLRSDPIAVDELLDSVIQRFRGQATRAGITFMLGEPSGAIVHGDRLGMSRMIANIVENSLRFTRPGGRITLASFAARDGVVLEVTDTGVGMSEERLASLSQPFALGDATFTRDGVGPGLGISISRAIAEQSGGKLAIDSSPSHGTTVAISLPISSAPALRAA